MFFRMVLIPLVPDARHETPFAALGFRGVGYSIWKTGLFWARKFAYLLHSFNSGDAHCSFTANDTIDETVSRMSILFFRPICMPYFSASCCIHRM